MAEFWDGGIRPDDLPTFAHSRLVSPIARPDDLDVQPQPFPRPARPQVMALMPRCYEVENISRRDDFVAEETDPVVGGGDG